MSLSDDLGRQAFGMTKAEAHAQRICISCKQPPTFSTDAGRREYQITAVCEPCFDKMFPPEEDE